MILAVLCLSLSKHCSAKCGICCCGSQDMLMVVDLVIIACGYAELILGERWPPSKGELIRESVFPPQGFMVGYPPTTNHENQMDQPG